MVGRRFELASVATLAMLASSCGGGGGGGVAGPSGLVYGSPPAYVVNQAIDPLTPTVVGQVSNYSVTPGFPAGITLNAATGVISGTPTAPSPKTTYTVTASNSGGSTTTTLSIVVNAAAASISYPSSYYAYTANVASQSILPVVSGGAAVAWSITPALPPGLTFSTSNGTISGAPTAAAAPTLYTVAATNSGGTGTTTLTIAVAGAPLLDLGHAAGLVLVRFNGSSLISLDATGHWALQSYSSGTMLASGNGACQAPCNRPSGGFFYNPVDVAGGTAVAAVPTGVELLSATNGQLLATLFGTFSWFQLASDGSYVSTGSASGLTVWNTSGQTLVSLSGDYSKALVFSAPGQVQVALGPSGQNVIQTVSVPGGVSSVSTTAFEGTFDNWFMDGTSFITNTGSTVWTYSSATVQQSVTTVPACNGTGTVGCPLEGEGNWIWAGAITIYQAGASSPAYSGNFSAGYTVIPAATTIGIVPQDSRQLTVIDLSGATPASTSYTVPLDQSSAYAASSASTWLVGTEQGVILDGASLSGQPRYLTLGMARGIAAGTGYFAVATASGEILYFNASTDAQLGSVDFASQLLAMSSDGTVLAAASYVATSPGAAIDSVVNVYALPAASTTNTFMFSSAAPVVISLSGSGTVLAQIPGSTAGCTYAEVISTTGGAPSWCDSTLSVDKVQLSPDGTLTAASSSPGQALPSTSIYTNGTLATGVSGWAVGWLDDARVLVGEYTLVNGDASPAYVGAEIFSSTGNKLASSRLPQLYSLQPVTTNTVYSPQVNMILPLTAGAATWASADPFYGNPTVGDPFQVSPDGAVSGSQVIFASGNLVLAQPY